MQHRRRHYRFVARLTRCVATTLSLFSLVAYTAETSLAEPTEPLSDQIDRVLAKVQARPLRSDRHTPWLILHGVIAFEQDLTVYDAERDESVAAIEYLLTRARHDGRRIFREVDGAPTLPPRQEYFQVQDHVDQYLMALADAGVPLEHMLVAEGGRRFQVADLVATAQRNFEDDQELGWTLVAMSSYVPFEQTWTNADGRRYRTEDLVRLAIARDPRRETEGGAHHLYGVAYALRRYRSDGHARAGTWRNAATYLREYVTLARRHQQADGSFSGAGFRASVPPGSSRQLVSTTGHMLEWIAIALPAHELKAPWLQHAVKRLCVEMLGVPLESLSEGGIYHAAHALRLYREAVFGP